MSNYRGEAAEADAKLGVHNEAVDGATVTVDAEATAKKIAEEAKRVAEEHAREVAKAEEAAEEALPYCVTQGRAQGGEGHDHRREEAVADQRGHRACLAGR